MSDLVGVYVNHIYETLIYVVWVGGWRKAAIRGERCVARSCNGQAGVGKDSGWMSFDAGLKLFLALGCLVQMNVGGEGPSTMTQQG